MIRIPAGNAAIARRAGLALLLAVLLLIAYAPGLTGPFVFDDAENITANPGVALDTLSWSGVREALAANDSGPFGRPLASLSFALNHYLAGGFESTFPFKLTNLAIHAVNAWLVYLLLSVMLRTPRLAQTLDHAARQRIAMLAAVLWAIHPLQLTSILYVVQRMTSLSALFVLAGLLLFTLGRLRLASGQPGAHPLMLAGLCGGTLLGVTAKETAVLLPLYAAVIELVLFYERGSARATLRHVGIVHAAGFAVPALLLAFYLIANPTFIGDGYATREFSPLERLLTECRVLWMYLGLVFLPSPPRFGIFHDDFALSTDLITPLITLPAVLGIIALLLGGLTARARYPVFSFGVLWFVAGHSLESSVFGLELAHEHRNYLPSLGPLVVLSIGVTLISARANRLPRAFAIAAVFLIGVFGLNTWVRAHQWSDLVTLAHTTARDHPASPRALDFAARASLTEGRDPAAAVHYTLRGIRLRPLEAGFHIDLHVILGVLASDLESRVPPASQRKQAGADAQALQLAGLDELLTLRFVNGKPILSHAQSDAQAVRHILGNEVLSVHTVVALENLRRCTLETSRPCGTTIEQTIAWHRAAAANPRSSRVYRGIIAASTARLLAYRGDLQPALAYMQQAISHNPGHLAYHIGATEYLLRLGQFAAADRMLETLTPGAWGNAEWRANQDPIQRLKALRARHNTAP